MAFHRRQLPAPFESTDTSQSLHSSVDFRTPQHRRATVEVEEVLANFKQVRVTGGQDGTRSVDQALPTLSPLSRQKDSLTRNKLYTAAAGIKFVECHVIVT